MFNLMKLELLKRGTSFYKNWLIGTVILTISVLALLFAMILFVPNVSELFTNITNTFPANGELANMQNDFSEVTAIELVQMLIGVSFIIYSAVMQGIFVVQDVSKHEVENLFTYPVARQKLIGAKVTLALVLSIVAYFFVTLCAMLLCGIIGVDGLLDGNVLFAILLDSLVLNFIGLGALYIGLWRKSVVITVITGFILASCFRGNAGTFSLAHLPIISYIFAAMMLLGLLPLFNKIKKKEFLQ